MAQAIVILTSYPKQQQAIELAKHLVQSKLAACVNILSEQTSIYEWHNQLEVDTEFTLIIKTQEQHYNDVEAYIKSHHPYELPEIFALPITKGFEPYLTWIQNNTTAHLSEDS